MGAGNAIDFLPELFQVPVLRSHVLFLPGADHEHAIVLQQTGLAHALHNRFEDLVHGVGRIEINDVKGLPFFVETADGVEHIFLEHHGVFHESQILQVAADDIGGIFPFFHHDGALCPAGEGFDAHGSRSGEKIEKAAARNVELPDIEKRLPDFVRHGAGIQPGGCFDGTASCGS